MGGAPDRRVAGRRLRGRSLAAIAVAVGTAGLGSIAVGSAQQPSFRTAVDLIAVDVQVTDRTGHPVLGLEPSDFQITIDGRRRRIVSAQFIQGVESSPMPGLRGPGPYPTNEWPAVASSGTPARTFVLAVDAGSIAPTETPGVIRAATRFASQVPAGDRIGVIVLPTGTLVPPTADRGRIMRALASIVGVRRMPYSRFELSLSEMIDLSWQAPELRMQAAQAASTGGRGGGPIVPSSDPDSAQTVQRECQAEPECLGSLLADAESLAYQIESSVSRSLTGLTSLLALLNDEPGRKTVVVLSAGMPMSDRPGGRPDVGHEIRGLGELAARANAVVYAVHLDHSFRLAYSAQARAVRLRASPARDRHIESKLLEDFTSPSGGALLTSIADDGELAFDRILRETSAYYLIGIEAENADRDGHARALRVRVGRRGVDVRSRQWVIISRPNAG